MKVADSLDRHKILDEFESGKMGLFTLELLALECRKKITFDFVRSKACLILLANR